jgi:DNA-binding MarR family transcriptional regulator
LPSHLLHDLDEGLHQLVRFRSVLDSAGLPAGIDVSISESLALRRLLLRHEVRQNELGDYLGLEKSTVSRLVDSLHVKGWVTRSTDPSNGRARIIALSRSGLEVAAQIDRAIRRAHARMIDQLTEQERVAVAVAIPALVRAMLITAPAGHRGLPDQPSDPA